MRRDLQPLSGGCRSVGRASSQRRRELAPAFQALAERTRAAVVERVASDADRLWRNGSRLTIDDAIALAFGTTLTSAR
jgi:hypothetical protein